MDKLSVHAKRHFFPNDLLHGYVAYALSEQRQKHTQIMILRLQFLLRRISKLINSSGWHLLYLSRRNLLLLKYRILLCPNWKALRCYLAPPKAVPPMWKSRWRNKPEISRVLYLCVAGITGGQVFHSLCKYCGERASATFAATRSECRTWREITSFFRPTTKTGCLYDNERIRTLSSYKWTRRVGMQVIYHIPCR